MPPEPPPPERQSHSPPVEPIATNLASNQRPDSQFEDGHELGRNQLPETGGDDAEIDVPEALYHLTQITELFTRANTKDDRNHVRLQALESTHDGICRKLLNSHRRRGDLSLRSQQAIMHHNFTAMRIDDLEKELDKLNRIVNGSVSGYWHKPAPDKLVIHLHELHRSNANDFALRKRTILAPPAQQPALEVLVPENSPRIVLAEAVQGETRGRDAKSMAPDGKKDDPSDFPQRSHHVTPERLRIRSRPLMSHLEKLSGRSILSAAGQQTVGDETVWSAVVFLRPFKFFVKYESQIRQSLAEVEARVETEGCENPEQSSNGRRDEPKTEGRAFDAKDLCEDLKLLINFLDVDLRLTFALREQIKHGTDVEIEYADLWHLFERGDIVVTRSNQAYARMVVSLAGGRDPLISKLLNDEAKDSASGDGFVVDCISFGNDGTSYVPKLEKLIIRKFPGKQRISSLAIYPLRFDSHADELRVKFIRDGTSFLDVTRNSFCHKTVRGKTLDEPSHSLDSQVIVDMTLAMNAKPEWRLQSAVSADDLTRQDAREVLELAWCKHRSYRCCGSDVIFDDLELDNRDTQEFTRRVARMLGPLTVEDLTEEHMTLMRPNVHAFVLRSRQWVTVRSADLCEVEFENNFKDLVLPDEHKTTVQALVKTHENSRTPEASCDGSLSIGAGLDLVKGKGTGLIILLHGPPGVGKTSTAECVADETRRPLYPITCGDIGETAVEVEHNLQYNFQLAHKWGCVLLLDEADVFLAKRTRSDLRHNAVTSVFIRSLEYYAGILFLTTNRVGAIDPAFRSRIHIALFYPRLNLDVTCKLYEKFISRARAEQDRKKSHCFRIKEKEIMRFAKRHYRSLEREHYETWNGRQIRNAFQTAIALTEHKCMTVGPGDPRPVLGKEQFEIVANSYKQFDEYLYWTLKGTDGDIARRELWRNDNPTSMGMGKTIATPAASSAAMSMPSHVTQLRATAGQFGGHNSDSDTSETDSDEEDEKEEKRIGRQRETGAVAAAAIENTHTIDDEGAREREEFQEYLRWKKLQFRRK